MDEDTRVQDYQSRINKHRLALVKGDMPDIDQMARDFRAILDGMDNIPVALDLDSSIVTLVTNLVIRLFYREEIEFQAHANGMIQYWMYKRLNEKWLNVQTKHGYENLDLIKQILDYNVDFYSLKFTAKFVDNLLKANDEVKMSNPVLYKSVDDFVKEQKAINNVNSFCKLDGFSTLEALLRNQKSLPNLKFINKVLSIVSAIKYQIHPDHRIGFFMPLKDIAFEIVEKYKNEQLKSIDKEELSSFVSLVELIVNSAVEQQEIT